MGHSASTIARSYSVGIDHLLEEFQSQLPVEYDKSLGMSRFLKTIRCHHPPEGPVILKIFTKLETGMDLSAYAQQLQEQKKALSTFPNILPFDVIFETDRAGYLARQYISTNLYDRISTRPFLSLTEKKWIAYQLLLSVSQAHGVNVIHGDIKTENVLVTSSNWVYLTDFGVKPTYLPEDHPADFSYYFDSSARRICYLAPERFYAPGDTLFSSQNALTFAMDIFSLGCTIAELFLEGTPLFTFSQLLRYRRAEFDPIMVLEKIEDDDVKTMIRHMIQLDPSSRSSAATYLEQWRDSIFPESFYTYLHPYMTRLTRPSVGMEMPPSEPQPWSLSDADFCIHSIWRDYSQITEWMSRGTPDSPALPGPEVSLPLKPDDIERLLNSKIDFEGSDVFLLITDVICANMRNLQFPSSKLKVLDLLVYFGHKIKDEFILDRLVPYTMCFLDDDHPLILVNTIQTLPHLLSFVQEITIAEANVFLEFIFPGALRGLSSHPDATVRASYVRCLICLAEISVRFLDLSQILRNASSPDFDVEGMYQIATYDVSLGDIQDFVKDEMLVLLVDSEPIVKRAILKEISRFCVFFGRQIANDVLLSHIITYLNDASWELRCSFFESVVGIATYLGSKGLEEYLLPLIMQSIHDAEEFVVHRVLKSLNSLSELRLIEKNRLREVLGTVLPLMCHPNPWIKNATIALVSCICKTLPLLDVRFIVYPMIQPLLKFDIKDITEKNLLESVKPQVNRVLYDQTMSLAANHSFQSELPWGRASDASLLSRQEKLVPSMASQKREPDLLQKLRSFGMTDDDQEKLFALKNFISKTAVSKRRSANIAAKLDLESTETLEYSNMMSLKLLGFTPRTIFLSPPPFHQSVYVPSAGDSRKLSADIQEFDLDSGASKLSISTSTQGGYYPDVPQSRSLGNEAPKAQSYIRSQNSSQVSLARRSWIMGFKLYSSDSQSSIGTSINTGQRSPKKQARRLTNKSFHSSPVKRGGGPSPSTLEVPEEHPGLTVFTQNILEKKIIEFFPPSLKELGERVSLLPRPFMETSPRGRSTLAVQKEHGWTPKGTLVSHFLEHSSSVNSLRISPDQSYFITGSDDGTVRLWDTRRLETNVFNRSRIIYSGLEGKVKSLVFCENRNAFAAASDNGKVHVCKVATYSDNGVTKLSSCKLVRSVTLNQEYANFLEHSEIDSHSMLLIVTNRGNIRALDLRMMKEIWVLNSPPEYGEITACLFNKKSRWLLTGTSRGVVCLWDTRFQIKLKTWCHPSGGPITKMSSHYRESSKLVAIASLNDVSLWDISRVECLQVWCSLKGSAKEGSPEDFLRRAYPSGFKAVSRSADSEFRILETKPVNESVRTFAFNTSYPCMVISNWNRGLTLWNLFDVNSSRTLCASEGKDNAQFNSYLEGGVTYNVEYSTVEPFSSVSGGNIPIWHRRDVSTTHRSTSREDLSELSEATMKSFCTRMHKDLVNDIAFLEVPQNMMITVGRDGTVNVWK